MLSQHFNNKFILYRKVSLTSFPSQNMYSYCGAETRFLSILPPDFTHHIKSSKITHEETSKSPVKSGFSKVGSSRLTHLFSIHSKFDDCPRTARLFALTDHFSIDFFLLIISRLIISRVLLWRKFFLNMILRMFLLNADHLKLILT